MTDDLLPAVKVTVKESATRPSDHPAVEVTATDGADDGKRHAAVRQAVEAYLETKALLAEASGVLEEEPKEVS